MATLKQLEQEVIDSMRAAIAAFDTDHSVVRVNMEKAHNLFRDHEWSEAFYTLYNGMLEIYCAYTPKEKGHYRRTHIGIGYSSFRVQTWVVDKVQPPRPTAEELVARFDCLLCAYAPVRKRRKASS
jgi:hypothetical protein